MQADGILVSAAVEGEVAGIRRNLVRSETYRQGRQTLACGMIKQQKVGLVVTGPGIANTVHGLTAALAVVKPELIIQTGCGGGFEQAGLAIGNVAVASEEIDVQLGLETTDRGAGVKKLPFPVISRPGKDIYSVYPVDQQAAARAAASLDQGLTGTQASVRTGPFITVATITASAASARDLHRQYGALVENMEGAGAAHVAALYDIPFLEVRAVSNVVGIRDKGKWNLPLAFERCARAVMVYLENRLTGTP